MQKTTLTIFGVLLISASVVQAAAASPQHKSKVHSNHAISELRGAYNQVNGPVNFSPTAIDRFDQSIPRSEDPVLNPPGS